MWGGRLPSCSPSPKSKFKNTDFVDLIVSNAVVIYPSVEMSH